MEEAAVGFGTLTLAAVTAWLAWETRRLGGEAVRTRLDQGAPRLAVRPGGAPSFVTMFPSEHLGQPWVPVGTREFVVPAESGMRVGMQSEVLLTNEGDATVFVDLDGPSEFVKGVGAFDLDLLGRADAPLPFKLSRSRWAIAPKAHALLLLRTACSVSEWIERDGREDVIELRATTQQASAVVDRWLFHVWARPLVRSEQDAGRIHQTTARQPFVADAFMRVTVSGPARSYGQPGKRTERRTKRRSSSP